MNELKKELYEKTEIDMNCYIAKSNPKETLKEHTEKVLKVFSDFIRKYPKAFTKEYQNLMFTTCYYHDFGKANKLFQDKINGKTENQEKIYHNFLSPLFLPKEDLISDFGIEDYKVIATAIFYHHTRDFDCTDEEYKKIFNDYIKNELKDFNVEKKRFKLKDLIFSKNKIEVEEQDWEKYCKIKGMLNRFDYAASSGVNYAELENKNNLITKGIKANFVLNEIQEFASNNQNNNIIVVASTGLGKTEASLLWLGTSKGFYTLPLKVASNDIYKRCKKYGEDNNVALIHSDSFTELLKNDQDLKYDDYKEMKRLSYPLTICTVDQIFKFPFKSLGQEQFIATLSYSKVIIDEIQMYSPIILACILTGLKTINDYGGKFAIITATMPLFLEEQLEKMVGKNSYKKIEATSDKKRHFIKILDQDFNYEEIIKDSKEKKVLVICNTVKKSIEVFKKLEEEIDEVHLLHARFIKKDRTRLEEEIKSFNKPGVWVTTQIVEASLDISFDVLHTEISPADSLIQRLGRCNRKGNNLPKSPNVFIYNTKINNHIYDENLVKLSLEKLEKYNNTLIDEKEKLNYINSVYNKDELTKNNTKYIEKLKKAIIYMQKMYPMKYDNNELQSLFRDINTVTIIPDEVDNINYEKINNLIEKISDKKLSVEERYKSKEQLMEYTTNIYFDYKKDLTLIAKIKDIYRVKGKYSKKYGFEREVNDEGRFI